MLLRQLVITLPAAAILSGPFGLTGIWASFILAESIAAGAALLFYNKLRKTDPVLG